MRRADRRQPHDALDAGGAGRPHRVHAVLGRARAVRRQQPDVVDAGERGRERLGLAEVAGDHLDVAARAQGGASGVTDHGPQSRATALEDGVRTQQALLAGLTREQREQLDGLLRELLASVTQVAETPPGSQPAAGGDAAR